MASVADVDVVERDVDEEWCEKFASDARGARVVVIDGNLSARGIRAARRAAATTATWFEPVSVAKAVRIVESGDAGRPMVGVRWCSPNAAELRELANAVRRSWAKGSPMSPCPFNPELEFDAANDALDALASDIATVLAAGCERVVLTLGSLGVIVSSAPDGDASNAEHAHVPAFAVKSVASPIGAGDALVGGAVGALARTITITTAPITTITTMITSTITAITTTTVTGQYRATDDIGMSCWSVISRSCSMVAEPLRMVTAVWRRGWEWNGMKL